MSKFHRPFLWIISFVLVSIVSSCFEIVEEVELNDNGTGKFSFTINMSQSKIQINSMLLLDSVNGRPMPKKEDFKKAMERVEFELNKDSSISNVTVKQDWEDYIFSISGNFQNVAALNNAIKNINTVFNDPRGYTVEIYDNFKYQNKVFDRLYSYNLVNDYNAMSEKDKAIFKNAKYTTVYRFSSPVKSYSNADALKSKSGKAIMLKVNVKELITNKKTIKNTIELK
ncbi:MAG: hypothetical protein P1P88_18100 [Bacteroidales bacterium]|nr:hypothetical protein [Bacteroidales bacterium]